MGRFWSFEGRRNGGDEGDRTPDLCNAIAALSQLSYVPWEFLPGEAANFECNQYKLKNQASRGHLPLNSGFRFSRNAATPSFLSSVEKQMAKRSTSLRRPSSRFERDANLTASFASCSAIGALSAIFAASSIVRSRSSAAG